MAFDSWQEFVGSRADTAYVGVHIEGIPRILVNKTPVDQDGVAWSAPTDAHGNAYTVTECLRLRDGLTSVDSTWKPKEGVSEGGAFTLDVVAINDTIRQLFAEELATANRSRVVDDIPLTGEDAWQVDVESTADFAASGLLYRGRETIAYSTKTATRFGDSSTSPVLRGCFNWRTDSILKRYHKTNEDTYQKAIYVSDHPAQWRGRRVTVLLWQADEYGRCYDDAYRGDHEVEIRSGFINDVAVADNWREFQVSCHDLTRVLTNNVGLSSFKGELLASDGFTQAVYVEEPLELRVIADTFYTDANATTLGISNVDERITIKDYDGADALGLMTYEQLAVYAAQSVQDTINTLGYADSVVVNGSVGEDSGLNYDLYSLLLTFKNGTSPAWYEIRIRCKNGRGTAFDIPGNQLWWWSGTMYSGLAPTDTTDGQPFVDGAWLQKVVIPTQSAIGPSQTNIIVYPTAENGVLPEFPSSGYARIVQGDIAELVKYSGTRTANLPDGATQLLNLTRGAFGTTPQAFFSWQGDLSGSDGVTGYDAIAINVFVGWEDGASGVPLSTILLEIMFSSGTPGAYSADYDIVARECGLAIDPAAINVEAFEACEPLQRARRNWIVSEETTVEQLIKDEMVLNGVSIGAYTDRDGRYRLNPIEAAYPLAHTTRPGYSTTCGILAADSAPTIRQSAGKIVTAITAELGKDALTGEANGDTVTVIDASGREDNGEGETLKLKIPGFVTDPRDELATAAYWIFRTWGANTWLVEVALSRSGLVHNPGDAVDLTIPDIWRPDGTTGMTNVPAVCINNKKAWVSDSAEPGAVALFALWPQEHGFAPSFRVETYAGTPATTVTIADNVHTDPGNAIPNPKSWDGYTVCRDWMHGPAGTDVYGVRFWCKGDYANAVQRTVTPSATDGQWTLSNALPAGWTSAAYTIECEFDDYDSGNVTAEQVAYSYIADSTQTLGTSDDPHTWA